ADADVAPSGAWLVCVRERHLDGEVLNDLVTVDTDGSGEPVPVAFGCDFYSAPRISPDGGRLAWLTWDHPRMPWDGTELWVADVAADGALSAPRRVAGGVDEAVLDPKWAPSGELHFCSDRSGWWNLYRQDANGSTRALTELEGAEIGTPAWGFAMTRYVFL